MICLSNKNYAIVDHLKNYYQNLRWWHLRCWLFPKTIASQLDHFALNNREEEIDIAHHVINVVLNATNMMAFFYQWILGDFTNTHWVKVCKILHHADLLSPPHFASVANHNDMETLYELLVLCKKLNLITKPCLRLNFNVMITHQNPRALINALKLLQQHHLLKTNHIEEDFYTLITHEQPETLAATLRSLKGASLTQSAKTESYQQMQATNHDFFLSSSADAIKSAKPTPQPKNQLPLTAQNQALPPPLNILTTHQPHFFSMNTDLPLKTTHTTTINPSHTRIVAMAERYLEESRILQGAYAKNNKRALERCQNQKALLDLLRCLQKLNLLTAVNAQTNLTIVTNHQNIAALAEIMSCLLETKLINHTSAQALFLNLSQHTQPTQLANALKKTREGGLLTSQQAEANLHVLIQHPNPEDLGWVLYHLQAANLLDEGNRDAVIQHDRLDWLVLALDYLQEAALLTQESYQLLINYASVLDDLTLWSYHMHPDFFQNKPTRFQEIIHICQEETQSIDWRKEQLTQYICHEVSCSYPAQTTVFK